MAEGTQAWQDMFADATAAHHVGFGYPPEASTVADLQALIIMIAFLAEPVAR